MSVTYCQCRDQCKKFRFLFHVKFGLPRVSWAAYRSSTYTMPGERTYNLPMRRQTGKMLCQIPILLGSDGPCCGAGICNKTPGQFIPYVKTPPSRPHSNQLPTAVQRLIHLIFENEYPKQPAGSCRLTCARYQNRGQMKPLHWNIFSVWKWKRLGPVKFDGLRQKKMMLAADDFRDRCVAGRELIVNS